ncbi:amino acid ABC transporter permease [Bacillus wiedmannii]|uniref:amino acid ABC transporter permease n=1 Tax=Bacillus wiedmannii TaxID=1890302 RepID=UPI00019FEC4B|nr:amino acid ABC transporter permease [Bacillus wiedmannii]EEK66600.1 Polar amino acid ABC transporter, inner membrane subunit [Bacillus wiedmannii]MCC2377289.1 amino acid ABC transporter permease [Bacillus wiedmannii]MCC2421791.1 amino acid ABC transporter permease [Bacillus wiedmannii]
MKFDVTYFLESFPQLFKYVYITLGITVVSMIISFVIGIGLAIITKNKTKNKTKFLYSIARVYISFFRGTPLLVQLFVLYFGLPQIFPTFTVLTAMQATLIGLSLNNAAYLSEIIRGSLNAVESGQMDACLSVGMTNKQAMRQIIFPQAIRVAVPSLGNNFVGLLKESSLSFALGVAEILAQAKMLAAQSYRYMESYLAVAIVYWIITIVISWGQKKLEKKLDAPYL